ncbi:MAG: hypothetical protein GY804_09425 [Alphaproteobacteria bacterium]|nr:hypothetical protein [Alphaproteobacteria bacterium]
MAESRFFRAIQVARELNGFLLQASKPDSMGYYSVPVLQKNTRFKGMGGGQYDDESVKEALYNPNKGFYQALINANCYGEWQHPIYTGQPLTAWVQRCMSIAPEYISHFIKGIEPGDKIKGEETLMMVHKPDGPYGEYLEKSLKDPDKNTSYSFRGLVSEKKRNGLYIVDFVQAFDHVTHPGFEVAGSRYQPHLHRISHNSNQELSDCVDVSVALADIAMGRIPSTVSLNSAALSDIKTLLTDETLSDPDCIIAIDKINQKLTFKNGKETSIFDIFYRK